MHTPTVFISYSWDVSAGSRNKVWVLTLAEKLVKHGVKVHLDQWDLQPGQSLTSYMDASVTSADWVLIVCTPHFAERCQARLGGVGYEQQIVSGHLLLDQASSKFIPILREGKGLLWPEGSIPPHLATRMWVDFRDDRSFGSEFDKLLRAIFRAPLHAAPPLGKAPDFSRPVEIDDLCMAHGEGQYLEIVID